MLTIKLICVGKLKEREYTALCEEYIKRISRYAKIELLQISEQRLPERPSAAEIQTALRLEAEDITAQIPAGAYAFALCVEGVKISSEALAARFEDIALSNSKICFIVGGSFGLHDSVKARADFRLSFSKMTFPHHLFRVMLLEQVYRGLAINGGSPYHK